jgi:hypothetical protein
MFRRMLIGAVLLVALMAAPAAAQYDFTVTPGTVEPGGPVTVTGEGCSPGAEVTITLTQISDARAIGDTIVVATVIADENGAFTVTFDIPEGTAVGTYEVAAICDGEQVASAIIDVVDPGTATTTPATPPDDDIVRTGSDLNGLGLLGAGLITAGGIVLIATKARRHART